MNALDGLGVDRGAVVATLAWNSFRHLEGYFAVPCSGRVLHTLNIRLSPAELAFVMRDAEDSVVLTDPDFIPVLQQVADQVPTLRHIVVLGDGTAGATRDDAVAYEPLIAAASGEYDALDLDERSLAGLCYTSGTTGLSGSISRSGLGSFPGWDHR